MQPDEARELLERFLTIGARRDDPDDAKAWLASRIFLASLEGERGDRYAAANAARTAARAHGTINPPAEAAADEILQELAGEAEADLELARAAVAAGELPNIWHWHGHTHEQTN